MRRGGTDVKLILLAAGRGSRLGELTKDKPKCMCKLAGKTLLERCLTTVEEAGFLREDIGIVTGYKREMFEVDGVTYFHNETWEQTNMFYSLTMAKEWLETEPCIVCYSDIVFHKEALLKLKQCKEEMALTYYTDFWELWEKRFENPLEDLETFRLDKDGYLLEIGKEPKGKEEIEGQYMGLILFTPSSWNKVQKTIKRPLPKSVETLDMTTLLHAMIEDGEKILGIPIEELWLECDTEQDIKVYEREYQSLLAL